MQFLSEEDAKLILEPYVMRIAGCVADAVHTYFHSASFAAARSSQTPRTAAGNRHDMILSRIRNEFEIDRHVRCIEKNQLFMLEVSCMAVLRFNQFNEKHLAQWNRNQQSFAYIWQNTPVLGAELMPRNGLLSVGYTVDDLQGDLEQILIVCRHGNVNIWEWDITKYAYQGVNAHFRTAQGGTSTVGAPLKREIRRKDAGMSGDVVNDV